MHGLSIHKSTGAIERHAKISSFVAGIFLLVFCPNLLAQSAQDLANKMNTEQRVGQVMIWSFSGVDISSQLEQTLTKYQPGALILFRRNISSNAQVAKLNTELQKIAGRALKAPLFLMIDQEGGVVTRVKVNTPIPSALALGKSADPLLVEKFARTQGDLLQALGFNVNLAPVMDISNPDRDTFIGNRTFGDDPKTVTDLSLAYAKGMADAGVVPTGKHFPGHGGTMTDSHKTVPKKMSTIDELEGRDFIPFQNFASVTYPRFVMTAHLSLPQVDPEGVAATYSPVIINEYLREKLGYKGVVITDDLEMRGAAISPDIGERAVRAFLAGNDMLMLAGSPRNQRQAFRSMIKAVNEGRVSRDRLNESVVRILEAKAQLKAAAGKIDEQKANSASRKLEAMSKEVMEKNFKIALEHRPPWPEVKPGTRAVVFSSTYGFYRYFQKNFKGKARHFHLSPQTIDEVADTLAKENADLAIFYASGSKTAHWLRNLSPALKSKMIVVNCNHAGEIEDQGNFLSVLNLSSHSPESGMWLADELNLPPQDLRTPAGDLDPNNNDN